MGRILVGLLMLCAVIGPAHALDLGIEARAEVGIDPATLEFIRTLPEAYRPQIKAIVDDTLDRVDESVAEYLTTIDQMLTGKIIELQCATVGVTSDVVDQLTRLLPWMDKPQPIADLRAYVTGEQAKIRLDHTPLAIRDRYSDLLLAAAIVSCKTSYVPEAQKVAKEIVGDLRKHWLAWNRIVTSVSCPTFGDCLTPFRNHALEIVRNGDARDDQASGAQAGLVALIEPGRPGFFQRFNPEAFENHVLAVAGLEDKWRAQAAARMARADKAFKKGAAGIAAADKAMKKAKADLTRLVNTQGAFLARLIRDRAALCGVFFERGGFKDRVDKLTRQLASAGASLTTALTEEPKLAEDVAAQIVLSTKVANLIKKSASSC